MSRQVQAIASDVQRIHERTQREAQARKLLAQAEKLASQGKVQALKLSLDKLQQLGQTGTLETHRIQIERLLRRAEGWPAVGDDIVFVWRREDGAANLKAR
ncbi:MAG: hypothetical protein QF886_00475, partial [Planctomycetota bacterium]|nr:hypothetical protein [Planctomycetota bacterium]